MDANSTPHRKRWPILAGAILLALGVMSFTAYSLFSGANSTDLDVNAGTLVLDLNDPAHGAAMSIDADDIAPTDIIERVVDLDVTGTVSVSALKLTTTAPGGATDLTSDATHGLQLKIEVCDQAWDPNDNGHPYECGAGGGGAIQTALATRAVIGANLTLNNLDLAGNNHLKIIVTFPGLSADDDATFQADSTSIHFAFSGTQRGSVYK
jgi:hypothetical protein